MRSINEIIEFESENSSVDFKAIIYKKEKFQDLLKDVIAFANSKVPGDRYIITGVNIKKNGERDLIGVDESDILDSANYEQLIDANIEPYIPIGFFIHEYKGKKFGIFRIKESIDKPFMMKKEYKEYLKIGDSFIRKGTHQMPLTRKDYDEIYKNKFSAVSFSNKIKVWFSGTEFSKNIDVFSRSFKLPSELQAEMIREIIKNKERTTTFENQLLNIPEIIAPFRGSTYEERDIETLRENLKNVRKTYQKDDQYEIYEINSNKINISLLNTGDQYLENCSVELSVPKIPGMFISDRIYEKPEHLSTLEQISKIPKIATWEEMSYPSYNETSTHFLYHISIGDLKHNIVEEIFSMPLRIVLMDNVKKNRIQFSIIIHGKNLKIPIEEKLTMNVRKGTPANRVSG